MTYTTEDYFDRSEYGESEADRNADVWVRQIIDEFDDFLSLIDCEKDAGWEYCGNHLTSARPKSHGTYPDYFVPREVETFRNNGFSDIWNRHFGRLRTMFEWLERTWNHLDNAADYWGRYAKRRDKVLDKRHMAMAAAYERYVDSVLEELCDEYMRQLDEACDYSISDEAAEEWVRFMNESVA